MNFAQLLMYGPRLTGNHERHRGPGGPKGCKSPEQIAKYMASSREKRYAKYREQFVKHPNFIMNTSQLADALKIDNSSIGKALRSMCKDTPPVVKRLKPVRLKGCSREVNVYQWIGD